MRGFTEQMERLARTMPEGREPTVEEVEAAMRDEYAARIDNARDRMDEFVDPPDDDELMEDMG